MSKNQQIMTVIVIFQIYDQFGAIRKPDSGCIVCKTYIFINSNFLSYKNFVFVFCMFSVLFPTKNVLRETLALPCTTGFLVNLEKLLCLLPHIT